MVTETAAAYNQNVKTITTTSYIGSFIYESKSQVVGKWNVDKLNKNGSVEAAHEFGHLLVHFYNKLTDEQLLNPDLYLKHGFNNHADRSEPAEKYYIMNTNTDLDQSKRRVNGEEYSRLNGGRGIHLTSEDPKKEMVDPNNKLSNKPLE